MLSSKSLCLTFVWKDVSAVSGVSLDVTDVSLQFLGSDNCPCSAVKRMELATMHWWALWPKSAVFSM